MEKYLVESPHTTEDCGKVLKQIGAAGYLTHIDWGCKDGVHCGWVVLEAESPAQAMMVVPTLAREKARVVRLNKFNAEDVRPWHPL